MKRKIGLDLGTGKCCVAIARDGKVTVLPDARGDKTTPSFVAFNEYRMLAGSDARDQANINATNTAYGIKIILGRTLKDPVVVRKLNSESNGALPFPPYRAGGDGVPKFQFKYKTEELSLRPEQIAALLIGKMKSVAEKYLDSDISGAVISVPVSFNTAQRQATLDAARIAGLKNSTLVNCTTAAAVAYWDHTLRKNDCIAVVDIGAGSVNFAIISITSGNIKVEEAFGDCEVGGSDIDLCMMSVLIQKFNKENSAEFQRSTKALMRLRRATESLKHTLSLLPTGRIQEDAFSVEDYTSMSFTRDEMVESCEEVLSVVSAGLSRLKNSKFWDKVRCAVVVGGSTRIPAVQHMISSELNKPVDQSLNKDEAIACGAALLGSGSTPPPEVVDVLCRRIWCESKTDDSVVFDVGTALPRETKPERPLSCDMEVWENLTPLEGEKQDMFKLCSLEADNKNNPDQTNLLFSVDKSGIFRAERFNKGESIDIALKIPCLNNDSLPGCVETHKRFLRECKELEENEDAMNDLEYFCSEKRLIVEEELDGNQELSQLLDSVLQWLEDTPDATKKECDLKRSEINDKIRVLKPHARQEENAKQEDDLNTPMSDEQVLMKPDGDRTGRLVEFTSSETKTIEIISYQTGSAGKEGDSKITEYYNDNSTNSGDRRTNSKDSTDVVPCSNDHNMNSVPTSGSQSKPSTEVSSPLNNTFKNSSTQESQSHSAHKLPVGDDYYLWPSGSRAQLTDTGHQPVPHTKPSPGKGSPVRKGTTLPPSEMYRPQSKPSQPDHLTGSPRGKRHQLENMTGDLGLGSNSGCMGSDYNISHNYSQQSYQSEGYPPKRHNEHTNRNVHQTIPGVHHSFHAENMNRGITPSGSRPLASCDEYYKINQNYGNISYQGSRTPGIPNLANDVRSPQVDNRSRCQSTGRSVAGSVVRQRGLDRSRQNRTRPAVMHGSGGHAHQYNYPGEPGTRQREADTKIPMRGMEVDKEGSKKSEKTSIPWYKIPTIKLANLRNEIGEYWNNWVGKFTEPQPSDEAQTYV